MPKKSLLQSLVVASCAVAIPAMISSTAYATPSPTQYVVISFDSAREIEQWERSRELARDTGAHFTYFLSCVFLLMPENKQRYDPPHNKAGASNIGFGASRDDLAARLNEIWTARGEGHEIGSHGCGHFDGKDWTRADWNAEFDAFSTILRDAWTNNDLPGEPAGWKTFATHEITGFRAPYLSVSTKLDDALRDHGFTHDASSVSRGPVEPTDEAGLVKFSLPLIPEGPKERRVIAMDYNLYFRHSAAEEKPEQAPQFEERAYEAFHAAFERQYNGDRTPLQIGFHFRLMNDGAYWRALERFARETCTIKDVRCVSYNELTQIIAPRTSPSSIAKPAAD